MRPPSPGGRGQGADGGVAKCRVLGRGRESSWERHATEDHKKGLWPREPKRGLVLRGGKDHPPVPRIEASGLGEPQEMGGDHLLGKTL